MKNHQLPPRPAPDTDTPKLSPPEGLGPALAWHNPRWWKDGFRPALSYVFTILVVFLTAIEQGIGWMTAPGWWAVLLGISLLSVPYFRGKPFAAGAEWFRYGGKWVRTYELVSIRIAAYYGFTSLKLEDADGRRVSIQTGTVQQNPFLWDLVYKGIVHSTHNSRLPLDGLTRRTLDLPALHTGRPSGLSTIWSLLPLLSFGVLTPVAVAQAARRLHNKGLAWGAAAYALPIPAFLLTAAIASASDTATEWPTAVLVTGLIIAWLPGGLHAYRLRWRIFANPQAEAAREQILSRR
ncbi:hypothetical protein ACFQ07_32385 [Actinomadura adrarensis]|uniref:PH domain-containing protein n=1 Tax=Actinomadura adrarensis TaxID=1819600 RepID=A0ABW3CSJ2_9ACTN